jgi:hypothetical protein
MPRSIRIQTFEATLEKGDRALGWTIARVPFDPAKALLEQLDLAPAAA